MNVVFDLDGTLADDEHRVHYLRQEHPEWQAYFDECPNDKPMHEAIRVLHALVKQGHRVEIWTGRPDSKIEETEKWIWNNITYTYEVSLLDDNLPLRMRKADDYRSVTVVKGEWLDEATEAGRRPDLVFDDRNSSVAWWRAQGITCFHVQERDY